MNQEQQQFTMARNRLTKAVKWIILVCIAAFLVQIRFASGNNDPIADDFGMSFYNLRRLHIWTPISYMFLHNDFSHIFFNMLMLYFFGCEMENVLGTRRFIKVYIGCGVLSGIGFLLIESALGQIGLHSSCIGASGAIFGILGMFAAMYPDRVITLLLFFILPVTMTARTMIIGTALLSLFMIFQNDGNVAHSAHLAGGLAGYLYGLYLVKNPIILDEDVSRSSGRGSMMTEIKANLRRRTMHLVEDETPDQDEVNRILEKITSEGIEKLSKKERDVLDRAGKNGKPS